jgi:hypothetical protein
VATIKKLARILAYTFLILAGCDAVLMVSGIFPPKRLYGDPTLGFPFPDQREGEAPQLVVQSFHWRFAHSDSGQMVRNRDASRSRRGLEEIMASPPEILIAVGGDSQTGLPYRNDLTHPLILEEVLQRSGLHAEVVNGGQGGYSPLQAYLYFNERLSKLHPAAFILNLYTGNDFFDLMRYDDRPHYEPVGGGRYTIQPPVWYRFSNPSLQGTLVGRSRVWFVIESVSRKIGLWNAFSRISYLTSMARDNGGSFSTALAYVRAVARSEEDSLSYPPAFSAQILNQYLFFHFFPAAEKESLRRLAFLISSMKREHPTVVFVISPIPSAALIGALKADRLFLRKLKELEIDYDSLIAQEGRLYDSVCSIAADQGHVVIDNRPTLCDSVASSQAFMTEDFHLSPAGSRLLGETEARALQGILHSRPGGPAR